LSLALVMLTFIFDLF